MSKKRILIVDDFENTRFVVKFTLENSGYEVLVGENGEDAKRFLDGSRIDLIITDYNMPIMNGLDFSIFVRQTEKYKYVPILILTTDTDEKKKDLARTAQVTGWIQKPFKMDRFLKIVEKSLNQ
ncbi:MAG TPA: two-component system response regulator [Bacteroidales bacterium]|nr:two-component system response regulator [Bacteroidales bacterium]